MSPAPDPRLRLSYYLTAQQVQTAAGRRGEGLRPNDVLLLTVLYDVDGTSVGALAGRLGTSERRVDAVLGRLACAGYVEPDGDEVWLTLEGLRLRRTLDRTARRALAGRTRAASAARLN